MLREAGLMAVVLSCTGIGFSESDRLRKRKAALRELIHLATLLKGEIRYTAAPLQETFLALSGRVPKSFEGFLKRATEEMELRDGREMGKIFFDCAGEQLANLGLQKRDRERLSWLGGRLGGPDRETQLAAIGLYLEELEREYTQAEEEYRQKARVYRCLGLLGGLFLLILLV